MKTTSSLANVLFESKHLAFILLDPSGNLLECNQTFRKYFFDFDQKGDNTGKTIREFPFWNNDFAQLDKTWKELTKNGKASFSQHLKCEKESRLYDVEMTLVKEGVLVSFTKAQENSTDKLPAKDLGYREKIASLIFHDLRAPVANVAYLLSIFQKRDVNEKEVSEFIEALQKSTNQALKVIHQIGGLADLEVKSREEARLSLRGMIDQVLQQFEGKINSAKARVVVDIQDQEEWKIPRGAFQMILSQIISNSLRFAKLEETPKIVITCCRINKDRVITVIDNGVGFDVVENEHRLFGLFQTFHDHPDARGIGLFQVKNRLLSIGGEISLDSQKGRGTTVTLNFKQNEFEEAPLYH